MTKPETPEDVKALSRYVLDWTGTRNNCIMQVKDAPFSELVVRRIPLPLGIERKTQYACTVEIVPQSEMDEIQVKVYRQLKRMECELAVSGILKKKFRFIPAKTHKEMKKRIKGYTVNPMLLKNLNQNQRLMRLIQEVMPDEMKISLTSVDAAVAMQEKNFFDAAARFYNNPSMIAWIITLTKFVTSGFKAGSVRIKMFEILKETSEFLLDFTKNILKNRHA